MKATPKQIQRLRERVQIFKDAMHNAIDRAGYKRQRDNWKAAQLTLERAL